MIIRRAQAEDIPAINRLLEQVLLVHHEGRPDLFRKDSKKYNDMELQVLLGTDSRPVFTGWSEEGTLLCYAFCKIEVYSGDNVQMDRKTLYIDDLCVEENERGRHYGSEMYHYALNYARSIGCYNVTLNAWVCNPGAVQFYEAMGMKPYRISMEEIL